MLAGYVVYAQTRSWHGRSLRPADTATAYRHGKAVLDLERALHLDVERGLQSALLQYKGFVQVVGGFYGSGHFIVTFGVLLWLYKRRPASYRFWRSVLGLATMVAVVIFALYPVMPPRLLPPGLRTVDTLDVIGGLWSYNHGVLEHITDPFAAMPSLHLAWSSWVAASLSSALPARRLRTRVLVWAYPALTYFTVILTGTHYLLDGVAGMALLGLSYLAVRGLTLRVSARAAHNDVDTEAVVTRS